MADVIEFRLPSLGADMDSGTVIEWLVNPGDEVGRGDTVVVVGTEKSDIEVEIWEPGVVRELLVSVGDEVPVGTTLALLDRVRCEAARPMPAPMPQPGPELMAVDGREREPEPAGPASSRGVQASPLARRLAAERGIDLTAVAGTGPGGAVVRADLEALDETRGAAGPSTSPESESADTARGRQVAMRHAIAALMSRSKREIPHYYLADDIDMTAAVAWLHRSNSERPVAERVLLAALLLRASALAVARHPELNGFWVDGEFRPGGGVHLGVAVSLRGGGLVAPAIHDADRLSVDELMGALRDLVARARAGRLKGSEMSGPTLTVTNLGDRGARLVYGVIYPPQVALVGFGRVESRPVVVDDAVAVRQVVTATLAADHRATDGERGARFLATLTSILSTPEDL